MLSIKQDFTITKNMLTSKWKKSIITLQNIDLDREQHYNVIKQYNVLKHKHRIIIYRNKQYNVAQQ